MSEKTAVRRDPSVEAETLLFALNEFEGSGVPSAEVMADHLDWTVAEAEAAITELVELGLLKSQALERARTFDGQEVKVLVGDERPTAVLYGRLDMKSLEFEEGRAMLWLTDDDGLLISLFWLDAAEIFPDDTAAE